MSPDNKRDLMQLLGNGLDSQTVGDGQPPHLGLHAGKCSCIYLMYRYLFLVLFIF